MLRRLPLWMGFAGAGWMVIAIRLFALQKIALRSIMVTNYIGFRTGMMLPYLRREVSMWDVWILNAWIVLTGSIEFALVGLLLRFAIGRFSKRANASLSSLSGLN